MYAFEQHIRVWLEFPAMREPVEISVPWRVLFDMDLHAERRIAHDGAVVYRHYSAPERRQSAAAVPARAAA